jgi:hypothetical protein
MPALGGGSSLPRHVALVDNCAVQYVLPGGQIQVVCRICLEAEGLERGELVDGCNDRLLLEGRDGDMVAGGGGDGAE